LIWSETANNSLLVTLTMNKQAKANRANAKQSTGPKSTEGKWASSQNSRKHGLNIQVDFESSDVYVFLKFLLSEEGFSSFMAADIATSLLNYRRVMDAYYDVYTRSKPVSDYLWNVDLVEFQSALMELSVGTPATSANVRSSTRLAARLQRNEYRQGTPVVRRTVDCHKLIRYRRNAISRLSKAIRPA
jgi:hypothetical protein